MPSLWRKMLSIFVSVALVVSLCPTVAMATDGEEAVNWSWNEPKTVLTIAADDVFAGDADSGYVVGESMDGALRDLLGIDDAESVGYLFADMDNIEVDASGLKAGNAYIVTATYGDPAVTASATFVLNAYALAKQTLASNLEAKDGYVWVCDERTKSTDPACGIEAHAHDADCYTQICDHAKGHLPTCYSSTSYSVCTHGDSAHTGVLDISDVVTIGETTNYATWAEEHPAYSTVKAVYDAAYNSSYDSKYKETYDAVYEKAYAAASKYLPSSTKDAIAKATAEAAAPVAAAAAGLEAGAKAISNTTFCYTIPVSAEANQCEHTCTSMEAEDGCFELICDKSVHSHDDACDAYDWYAFIDVDNNGKADYTENVSVHWKNADGSPLSSVEVAYGTMPEYTAGNPAQKETAQYTYTFKGWTPAIAPAIISMSDGANTYTATYTATTNTYTVTWLNEDGSILETDTGVEYGSRPSYDGATPTKEAGDNEDGVYCEYTFSGWSGSPETSTVTEDVSYWATYSTEKCYQVAFETGDGSAVETKYVAENGTVTKPVDDPTREGYRFGGWYTDEACTDDDEYDFATQVTDDIVLYAKWVEQVTVTLVADASQVQVAPVYDAEKGSYDAESGVLTMDKGSVLVEPVVTVNSGYTFDGWYAEDTYSQSYTFGAQIDVNNTKVYAKSLKNEYSVTVEGEIVYSTGDFGSVEAGSSVTVSLGDVVSGEETASVAITPKAGYYIKGVTLDGASLETEFADGTVSVSIPVAPGGKYTLDVATSSFFVLASADTVKWYKGISLDNLKANILEALIASVPDGVTSDDLDIYFEDFYLESISDWGTEFVKLDGATINEFNETMSSDIPEWLASVIKGFFSKEKIVIKYVGSDDRYPAAETSEMSVSCEDTRSDTSISLNAAELFMPTSDTSFTEAKVLSAMGFALTGLASSVDSSNYVGVEGLTVSIVEDGTNVDLDSVSKDSTYTVTVKYAANNDYKASEASAVLTVTDDRIATSIAMRDAEVAYNEHKNWTNETWYADVVEAMGITLKGADAGVTLSLAEYPGAGTYTITASYAGDNTHKPAADASATLTLVAAPTASTIKLEEGGCQGATVEVNGTKLGGDVQTISVDNGASVVVTVSPAEGYYLTGARVNDADATDKGDGTFTYSFEAPYSGTEYIVTVDAVEKSAPVFTLTNGSIDVSSLNFSIGEDQIKKTVFQSVAVNGGTVTDAGEVYIASIDGVAGQTEIKTLGNHEVAIAYAGDSKTAAGSAVATLTVVDKRPATTIVANEGVRIGYVGQTITADEIAAALVSSVTSNGETVEGGTELVVLDGTVEKWGSLFGFVEGYYDTYSQAIGGNTLADLLDATGKYRVSVKFDGNDNYAASESVQVEFEVYDNRAETILNAKDVSVDASDLTPGKINYTAPDVEELVFESVTEVDGGAHVDGAEVDVVLIMNGASIVYSAGIDDYANGSISGVGEYTVLLQFEDTVTHKSSTATVKFTVKDARPETQVNLLGGKILDYTAPGSITDELVLEAVFAGVSLKDNADAVIASDPTSVTVTVYSVTADGESEIAATSIVEAGTYKAVVSFAETMQYLGSQASVEFSVSDGRNVTAVVANENVSVGLNPLTGEVLTAENIIVALGLAVMDLGANEAISAENYSVSFDVDPANMKIGGTYKATVSFEGNLTQAPCSRVVEFSVVDGRAAVQLDVNDSVEVPYGTTSDELLAAMLEGRAGLVDAETGVAFEGELSLSADISASNVGTYTVAVAFAGDETYQAVEAEVEVVVVKADTQVTVNSQTVTYRADGYYTSDFVSASPEANLITFAAGLNVGDNASADLGTAVYLNIPNLIDLSSVPELFRPTLENALGSLSDGSTLTVAELKSALEKLNSAISGANDVIGGFTDFSVDTTVIDTLIGILTQLEKLDGVGDLTIHVTTNPNGVQLIDSGLYLVGAVSADANYNTAYGLGYCVIVPDATKVELAFNIEDANGLVTYNALLNGSYDLGSHVLRGDLTERQHAEATAQLANLFIGVDVNGEPVIVDSQDALTIGTYTQLAYIADFGNEMYYAVPLVRAFAVVTDLVDVTFVDAEGNALAADENGIVIQKEGFQLGVSHELTAAAATRSGASLDSAKITYTYAGVEGDADTFYAKGKADEITGPTEAGVYEVIATYVDYDEAGTPLNVGMAFATLIIEPAEASVAVNDAYRVFSGETVDVADLMITKTPDDAKMAVITAGLNVSGDFTESGLGAVAGVVNVDFPDRVDELLESALPSAYVDGITIGSFVGKLVEAQDKLVELGVSAEDIDQLIAMLESMPDTTTLTFKEQAEVNPSTIGAYLVAAVIMDPNYQPAADLGVLVIGPKVTEATLDWNYNDVNGVITSPILGSVDMGASAYVGGVIDDGYTAKIQYLFVGIDENGNAVSTTDASGLGNGAYTEIAYILDEVSVNMVYAEPIMRSFVVAPQVYGVTFIDADENVSANQQFVYDGNAHAMNVQVTDPAGQVIGKTTQTDDGKLENLTVTYLGIEGDGEGYCSTEAPKAAGVYTAIAVYAKRDAAGSLLYAGAAVGTMTIQPAASAFAVNDTEVVYDGTQKFPEISNPDNLPYILSVVVDSDNNVNVIVPTGWSDETRVIENVGDVVATLIDDLEGKASVTQNAEYKAALEKLAEVLKTVKIESLTINGDKPFKVGTYTVHAIGFGDPNLAPAYDSGILTIVAPEEQKTDISNAVIGGLEAWYEHTGNAIEPAITVTLGGETLVKDVDYTVTYDNNIDAGTATVTVTGIGNYTGTVDATFEIVDSEALFKIYGTNVGLYNDLGMNFFVLKSDMEKVEATGGHYAEIIKTFADGRANDVYQIAFADWGEQSTDLWRFGFRDIAAKEMSDTVTVRVYDENGVPVSQLYTDSLRSYAMRGLEATASYAASYKELRTTLVDMLNYGAAAQLEFDYNTGDLANKLLTEAQKAEGTASIECVNSLSKGEDGLYYGTTVAAESNLVLTLYFTGIDAATHAVVTYAGQSYTVEAEDFYKRSTDLTGIVVNWMVVADCVELVTVEVYNGETLIASATDSIESYAARAIDKINSGAGDNLYGAAVYENMMKFANAARAYFATLQ